MRGKKMMLPSKDRATTLYRRNFPFPVYSSNRAQNLYNRAPTRFGPFRAHIN